jgi:MFS family permease
MIFYCPACWREVPESIRVCPHCTVDVERLTLEQDYVQKLIAALDHPEPTTPARVAWILGLRGEACAVPHLARIARESDDPYIVEAAVEALGRIGDPAGLEALRFASQHGGVRVREKAAHAIDQIQRTPFPAQEETLVKGEQRTARLGDAPPNTALNHTYSTRSANWLNRNVVGMGVTSLLSDACHEMATAVLPGFLTSIGAPPAALGVIEGVADATSSFVKLGAGWYSDRIGHRKAICVLGYFLTGAAKSLFALAITWPLVLVGRVIGWFGRGIRGPLRDAMLAESVPPEARGKAFGFHRAGDTLGAIIGPLLAVGVIEMLQARGVQDSSAPFRTVFLLTLIPGMASVLTMAGLVRERRRPPNHTLQFWASVRELPTAYRRFLLGVGLFGLGDYAHTFLILGATTLLTPTYGVVEAAQIAALLYVWRNVLYAAASYPVGALSDRLGRRGLLALGYLLGAVTAGGFGLAFLIPLGAHSRLVLLVCLFSTAGTYIAMEDTLEGTMTADLTPRETWGFSQGVLGTINGIGDLFASLVVGILWTAVSPVAAFGYAAVVCFFGSMAIYRLR